MKNKRTLFFSFIFATLVLPGLVTNVYSNATMLLMDSINFLPKESSIFTFHPYEINQGSSNWWIYGEDKNNYYYFSYEEEAPYYLIHKDNNCNNFNKADIATWCNKIKGSN